MRHATRRVPLRPRGVLLGAAAAAAAAVLVTGVTTSGATADPQAGVAEAARDHLVAEYDLAPAEAEAALARQEAAIDATAELAAALGEDLSGAVVDEETGTLTVHVDTATAGAEAEAVADSVAVTTGADVEVEVADPAAAALAPVEDGLEAAVGAGEVAGAAVSTDLATGEVVVSLPPGGDELDGAVAAAEASGLPVRVEHLTDEIRTYELNGGEAIRRGSSLCSAGFNLRSATEYVMLTAGHCGRGTWYDDGRAVGATAAGAFPGDDFQLVRITDVAGVDPRAQVEYTLGPYPITAIGLPPVGTTVCRTGATTGTRCGQVQGYDAVVRFAQGTVGGMVRTNVCAQPGDSGGPLFAADGTAVGVLSGGNGNCRSGGTTYYQSVLEIAERYGLLVI